MDVLSWMVIVNLVVNENYFLFKFITQGIIHAYITYARLFRWDLYILI